MARPEIALPYGMEFVDTHDIPDLIAKALHPDVADTTFYIHDLVKIAKPGASLETASRNNQSIDDDDIKTLNTIWSSLRPLRLPIAEAWWQDYEKAFMQLGGHLDWEPKGVRTSPSLTAHSEQLTAASEHRKALIRAIQGKQLLALDPHTRLPQWIPDAHSIVSVASLTQYVEQFHITVRIETAPRVVSGRAGTAKVDWQAQAREIADECFDRDTANNCCDSLAGYSSRVMEAMQKREMHGPRGRIDNANTIQREALQGKKWWATKKK